MLNIGFIPATSETNHTEFIGLPKKESVIHGEETITKLVRHDDTDIKGFWNKIRMGYEASGKLEHPITGAALKSVWLLSGGDFNRNPHDQSVIGTSILHATNIAHYPLEKNEKQAELPWEAKAPAPEKEPTGISANLPSVDDDDAA